MNTFKQISIRGRVAYAIECLENAVKHYALKREDWAIVLNKLWEYTSAEHLDDWHMCIAECRSEAVLEKLPFEEKGIEHLTRDEYAVIFGLYQNAPELVLELIDLIFDLGTVELYGRLVDHSPNTLNELAKLVELMKDNAIQLPDVARFVKFTYEERDGWGRKFERSEV